MLHSNRPAALKVLQLGVAAARRAGRPFANEARATFELVPAHIVRVLDRGRSSISVPISCVLHELLTRRALFQSETAAELCLHDQPAAPLERIARRYVRMNALLARGLVDTLPRVAAAT